jgi:hypothetical protein
MEEPQYRLQIATQRNGSVVCPRQHLLGMEVIRSKFSVMDSWKTSVPQPFTLSQGLIALPPDSGSRKERHLVFQPSAIYVLRTKSVDQFHDHREHQIHEEIWARLTGIFLL